MIDYSAVRLLAARHKEIIWQGRNIPPYDLPGALAKTTDERVKAWIAVSREFGPEVGEGFLRMYDAEMRSWVSATEYAPAPKHQKQHAWAFYAVLLCLFFVGFIIASVSH